MCCAWFFKRAACAARGGVMRAVTRRIAAGVSRAVRAGDFSGNDANSAWGAGNGGGVRRVSRMGGLRRTAREGGVYGAGDGGGSEELLGDGEEAGENHVAVDHHAQLVGIEPAAEL